MTPIADDEDIPPPSHDEVPFGIMRLKNNKAAGGFPAELIKAGGNELIGCMNQLLCKIWLNPYSNTLSGP